MIAWVVDGVLAKSCRPGYIDEGPTTYVDDVRSWVAEAKELRIKSIICLLNEELEWYRNIGLHKDGLLDYYRDNGFNVCPVPVTDGQEPPVPPPDLDKALRAFDRSPRPVLVHCKAGVDRTGAVIAHIMRSRLLR